MSELQAVLFDVDGVLVDSYRAHFQSWMQVAGETGFFMDERLFAETFGRTSREIIGGIWGRGQMPEPRVRELDDRKEVAYREIIRADFPAMPEADELLRRLEAAGVAIGVGSSGPAENVRIVLQQLGRPERFGAVVTGDDVSRGKPDPQVFLLGAERLGVPPACCVVVEDAPPGIEAARAAGMKSVGFASTGRTREELARADLVIDRLEELTLPRLWGLFD